jgi:hypothetical protein
MWSRSFLANFRACTELGGTGRQAEKKIQNNRPKKPSDERRIVIIIIIVENVICIVLGVLRSA